MTEPSCYECGKPRGSVPTCADCRRWTEMVAERLGGLRAFQTFTAERFKPSPITHEAFIAAKTFDPKRENLYLHGGPGAGKTHLAIIAARAHLPEVVTYTPTQIVGSLMECSRGREEQELVRRLARLRVFVIDDLGTENDTKASAAKLYELVNRRYMDSPGGLIVTSNLSLGDLAERMGEDRISSRLFEMCKIFKLDGEPDHRVVEKKGSVGGGS